MSYRTRASRAVDLGAITAPRSAARRRHRSVAERRRLELLEQLTGHEPAIGPTLPPSPLPCMTAAEWATFTAGTRRSRRELALEACAGCTLEYEAAMQTAGRCRPIAEQADTPSRRLAGRRYGVDEPIGGLGRRSA